jgi:hypothetical protein
MYTIKGGVNSFLNDTMYTEGGCLQSPPGWFSGNSAPAGQGGLAPRRRHRRGLIHSTFFAVYSLGNRILTIDR